MVGYRQHFTPSAQFPAPHAILAVSVIMADTDAEANDLALSVQFAFLNLAQGRTGPLPSPEEVQAYPLGAFERQQMAAIRDRHFVGSPATVRENLLPLIEATQADELMVLTMVHDHAARVRSFELLAEMFELTPAAAEISP